MSINRRKFLQASTAVGGLFTLGFFLPLTGRAIAAGAGGNTTFAPNAWLEIDADNQVVITVHKSEMGQGVYTSLPMLVAEELDISWDAITLRQAPVSPAFNMPGLPGMGTGGSSSVTSSYEPLRMAGATARAMLVAAAAKRWGVEEGELTTESGAVLHTPASGKQQKLRYAELAQAAMEIPVPETVPLKKPEQFRILGKDMPRLEARSKVTGEAQFGIDVRLPQMHYAVIARPPVFGAQLDTVDDAAAKATTGVVKVKVIPAGVAVIATSFWQAKKGREALKIKWKDDKFTNSSTAQMREHYLALTEGPGAVAKELGDTAKALEAADRRIDAVYEVPFLAHATMEPLNCTVHDQGGKAEVWTGTQMQTFDRNAAAQALGYPPEKVELHTTLLGGGFGRRGAKTSDFVLEAAQTAKGEAWPVKVVWTREDDTRGGFYRPMYVHRAQLGLAEDGKLAAWQHRVAGQPVMIGGFTEAFPRGAFDGAQVEGLNDLPYKIANYQLEAHMVESPITTMWWRSVGHSHTAFAKEGLIDEAAHLAGADPLAYRREMLQEHPRMLALLDKVAQMSEWGSAELPANTGLGIAIHESFGSIVAQVARVRVDDAKIKVEKVWCTIDCGFAVNPLGVRAQMESGINYGLSAALFGELTFDEGRVKQSNYHDYPVVRQADAPAIEVAIINSGEAMGGAGEPGTPPIAPAVANAVYAASGKRLRSLPLRL